ncbi:hypothetical protein [Alicyclobacillus macrosporangiidus]|jgi:hypothetical protein|uniref:Uncharacterized protein n=1 Tax=Alicyclobacillus macrosporangiidus TaxID=392015 RepID=A0A1I7FWC7_9BACL|nr:hypothetical protein [Alicyclobacillus macrosporangiidus]SFU40450.1 hypothetical protein SAMN05421543_101483 [Alicyclobacillus macrosporangiidus]
MADRKPISLDEIRRRAEGEVIDIPDWDGKGTIPVRVRRIDITPIILKAGVLPNSLKIAAQEIFEGKKPAAKQPDVELELEKLMPTLDAIAKECLLEPKYEDIQNIYPLTLNQKLALLTYVTGEVEQLRPFRGKQ